MDLKEEGNVLYILGETGKELGGSEYYAHLGFVGKNVPNVSFQDALSRYRRYHEAVLKGLVRAGHDCSDGGLAVALAEMAFSGEVGLEVDLAAVPVVEDLREDEVLFSESASRLLVEVKPRDVPAFEDIMGDGPWAGIGRCTAGKSLDILSGERQIMSLDLTLMKRAWQRTLREL